MTPILTNQPFDTNAFFSGGAGLFLQYHDVIKPTYLYAVIQMMITKQTYGLPVYTIEKMSQLATVEWYLNRRYRNPLQQLDFNHHGEKEKLDALLDHILETDPTIYKMAPSLAAVKLFQVYRSQYMTFPIYVYEEHVDRGMKEDVDRLLSGIQHKLFTGDLRKAISRCDQNFTYIFSDIESMKSAVEILTGTCSNVLLTSEYRYNKLSDLRSYRYNLQELATSHPFVRVGTTIAFDPDSVTHLFDALTQGGE